MGKKYYPQSIKDEAVLFYELGHSFAETQAKYGMAESTFFTWKQKFDKAHPMHEAITTNRTTCHNYETQNLNRARTQFKLTADMERNWDAMQKVIEKYC